MKKKKNKNSPPPFNKRWRVNEQGALMVEIIITVAILALISVSFLGAAVLSLRTNNQEKNRNMANNLAQEAIEAVRNFRDGTPWASGLGDRVAFPNGTAFYPVKSGSPLAWSLAAGEETIGVFKRKIVFSDSGVEPTNTNRRKVIATVSWEDKKVEIIFEITSWR